MKFSGYVRAPLEEVCALRVLFFQDTISLFQDIILLFQDKGIL